MVNPLESADTGSVAPAVGRKMKDGLSPDGFIWPLHIWQASPFAECFIVGGLSAKQLFSHHIHLYNFLCGFVDLKDSSKGI